MKRSAMLWSAYWTVGVLWAVFLFASVIRS